MPLGKLCDEAMSSMLGNLCMDEEDGVDDGENTDSSTAEVEGSSVMVISSILALMDASLVWSLWFVGAEGMKKLAPDKGFTDGAEGV